MKNKRKLSSRLFSNKLVKKLMVTTCSIISISTFSHTAILPLTVNAAELTDEFLQQDRKKALQNYIEQFHGGYIYQDGILIHKPNLNEHQYDKYSNPTHLETATPDQHLFTNSTQTDLNNIVTANNPNIQTDNSQNGEINKQKDIDKIFYLEGVINVTNSNGTFCRLYSFSNDGTPKPITNRALSNGTLWYTDQYREINNEFYSRVATNEWVKNTYITTFSAR
ncbi:hypothetical protein ACFQAV_01210 [Companilactobacillus huachuanensis]|uniref:Surface layer protein A domain-containing protein n=1 Tax=Companilactobacillus huachuanensis TaxID=2559914 RepID=A0ABW1RH55_9LACO|nr:hypothetical protein [Companilactobacillus huachuanensis]